jgi:UDP-N-acetylmuramate dehydrogenase
VTDPTVALARLAGALGQRAARDAPLGARTTYRVGGSSALMVEADDEETLIACHRALLSAGGVVPVLVIGKGSNMLVADTGFPGLAICLGGEFTVFEIEQTRVVAGGAVGMQALARATAGAGLCGFEWAVGIPGSLGGAVRMNAGGHGSEMSDVLVRARLFDLGSGEAAWIGLEELRTGYRQSAVKCTEVVVGTELSLRHTEPAAAIERVAEVVRWRQVNQPGGLNGGSVFKNPPGDSAGRLIDATGLKGLRVGSAEVSRKHANFFQADRNGSADDVRALIDQVRTLVLDAHGVELIPELRMIGFESGDAAVDQPSTSTSTSDKGSGLPDKLISDKSTKDKSMKEAR